MGFKIGDRVITDDSVMKRFRNKTATVVEEGLGGRVMLQFDDIENPDGHSGWSASSSRLRYATTDCVENADIGKFIEDF